MKTLGTVLLLMIGTAAYAQQSTPVAPEQTPVRPALQIITDDAATHRLDVEIGAVRLNTGSGRYTFAYLLPPLQGTAFRPSMEMPNALALTGTSIPQKRRPFTTQVNAR
jgi:hypothetical protein